MKGELQSGRIRFGGGILLLLLGTCIVTLPWTLGSSSNFYYDRQHTDSPLLAPRMDTVWMWFGTSKLGQSLMGQCLLGGVISLTTGGFRRHSRGLSGRVAGFIADADCGCALCAAVHPAGDFI